MNRELAPTVEGQSGAIVVNYHYCQPAENGVFSGVIAVHPDDLRRQADVIRERYVAIDLQTLVEGRDRLNGSQTQLLVTFDDGTRDVFEHALPVLRAHKIPAVLFCCSQPLLEHRILDVQKIHLLQARLGFETFRAVFTSMLSEIAPEIELKDTASLGLAPMYRYDDEHTRGFKLLLNVGLPYDVLGRVLDRLFEREIGHQSEILPYIYMSRDEILRARDMGFVIGLHTHSHRMLSRLDFETQRKEIGLCLETFEEILGERCMALSYPYGVSGTYNATTKQVLADFEIPWAFTLGRNSFEPSQQNCDYEIPRFDVNDVFNRRSGLASRGRITG